MLAIMTGVLFPSITASQERPTDEWLTRPVDDRTYTTYLDFFRYSHDLPLEIEDLGADDLDGVVWEHLRYVSTPGQRVYARLHQPEGSVGRSRAIVLLHGGTPPGKDSPAPRRVATLLARAGWTVLSLDMQYFGERATDLLQTFTEDEKHARLYNQPSTYLAWIAQNVKDVGRGLDLLIEERGIDPDRVALVGFSRGAQVSFIVGAVEERFAAVIAIHGGHFDAKETEHLPAACPANYIGRISPRPLLMINGRNDADYLPETSVEPLQRLVGDSATIRWTDTTHGVITEEDQTVIVEWLRENVR
jgi:dienelactone hydrolase